jgi:hypothetical protein
MKNATFEQIKPFAKQWHDLSNDMLIDLEGCNMTFGQVWAQIVEVWGKVKYAKGDALKDAKIRAEQAKYKIPELDWCEDENMHKLAKVCYELSLPDGYFFLSGTDAGKILGKTQKMGRSALKMFQIDGIIELVKKGHSGVASDYKYIGKPVVYTEPTDAFEQRKRILIDQLKKAESEE